ncbi:hypothetical protein E2C01_053941 [Portunus trituberculatus]|uniref:Uncharacterized protein n=1 Tax=Portunus trituberculatus TaxID=210409 RepID=A0A5B7GLP0_PORTR|nr:hypothetical protein [Portunus trituberculatus]
MMDEEVNSLSGSLGDKTDEIVQPPHGGKYHSKAAKISMMDTLHCSVVLCPCLGISPLSGLDASATEAGVAIATPPPSLPSPDPHIS